MSILPTSTPQYEPFLQALLKSSTLLFSNGAHFPSPSGCWQKTHGIFKEQFEKNLTKFLGNTTRSKAILLS